MRSALPLFTVGHSTRSIAEFTNLLVENGIEHLFDVRAIPHSRRMPQFGIDQLPASLRDIGIAYEHMPALGGRRRAEKGAPPSPHTYWRIEAFRHYADYAESPAFADALDYVLDRAKQQRSGIMCAEALWWRCHRRIITDYALARGVSVIHIMGHGKTEPATMTPGAQVLPDKTLRYVKEPQLGI